MFKKHIRQVSKNKKRLFFVIGLCVIIVSIGSYLIFIKPDRKENANQQVSSQEEQTSEPESIVQEPQESTPPVVEEPAPTPPVAEPAPTWPVQLTFAEASSLTVVVNKKHKLPTDYVPATVSGSGAQLRTEASSALANLLAAAQSAGNSMQVISSYRSYSTQVTTYNKWVAQSGQVAADTFSARPGHSEHQLGLAVDLGNGTCNLEMCFGNTAAGKWLASNAQNYGFIIRYPSGKDAITGYQYEPWHLRYVGLDAAKAITVSGQTMDEYYGVKAGDYQ